MKKNNIHSFFICYPLSSIHHAMLWIWLPKIISEVETIGIMKLKLMDI